MRLVPDGKAALPGTTRPADLQGVTAGSFEQGEESPFFPDRPWRPMRDVWLPGHRANILNIRLGVQDQCLDGYTWRRLAIGLPGQGTCPHLAQAQRDWLVIVRPDFDDHFRHRPWLGARLSQMEDVLVVEAKDPERPASDQVHIAMHSQVVQVPYLGWGPQGAILWRRGQWRHGRYRTRRCARRGL